LKGVRVLSGASMKTRARLSPVACFIFVLTFLVLFGPRLFAQEPSREELTRRYESVLSQAEQYGLSSEDPLEILPKLREAKYSLDRDSLQEAGAALDQAAQDLKLWSSLNRSTGETRKLQWLETYWDILQKFAFLALIAFLFIRSSSWRTALKRRNFPILLKLRLSLFTVILAGLFWGLDVYRYGSSVFAFFDMRIVLIIVSGLIGGWLTSLPVALILGAIAILMGDLSPWPLGLMIASALISGVASRWVKRYDRSVKMALGCGLAVGLIHGAVVYIPSVSVLPPLYMAFSMLLLAGLETAGVVLFFAVVSAVLREELSRDTENELLRTHLLFLQAQLRPHFLFNALNTIADVCHNGKTDIAEKLILKLSEFLRHSLDRKEERATFREEMNFMEAYLEIEKARFGESLCVEKKIDLPESVWDMKVPLLVFQPLVENAVRHGLRKKQGGGTLKITACVKEKILRVEISDTGAGKPEGFFADLISGKTNKVEGTGIGVRNIHQRLVRAYGADHGLQYEGTPSQGTKVTVRIPALIEGDKP